MALCLCIFADVLIPLFLGPELCCDIIPYIKLVTYGMSIFFIFDSIAWVLMGILTAGGDTRFTMIMNISASWLCADSGHYLACLFTSTPASVWMYLSPLYALVNVAGLTLRYYSYAWRKKII